MKNGIRLLLILLTVACVGCTTTERPATALSKTDTSIANRLYQSGLEFKEKQKTGDSLGMAYAARDRAHIVETLNLHEGKRGAAIAIAASTKMMILEAERAAKGDEHSLLLIRKLFPTDARAQQGSGWRPNQLFGKARKVDVTIGLEMDVRIDPGTVESTIVPVSPSMATTVFIHPAPGFSEDELNLNFRVSSAGQASNSNTSICHIEGPNRLFACVIKRGDFSNIEIAIENKAVAEVGLLVFVSGNAASVATAFAPQQPD